MKTLTTLGDMKIENHMHGVTENYTALLHYLEGSQWSKAAEAASKCEHALMLLGFDLNDILRP